MWPSVRLPSDAGARWAAYPTGGVACCARAWTVLPVTDGLVCCFQVHMGTHMWNNGASRRGRRMSLDLPIPPMGPMAPKDSDFLQRRPDLFYPYLPAPFLNGMQHKVSFNVTLPMA